MSWDPWTVPEQCPLSPTQRIHMMLLFTRWKKKCKRVWKNVNPNTHIISPRLLEKCLKMWEPKSDIFSPPLLIRIVMLGILQFLLDNKLMCHNHQNTFQTLIHLLSNHYKKKSPIAMKVFVAINSKLLQLWILSSWRHHCRVYAQAQIHASLPTPNA